ncbi:MAG: EAL domain-containing protein [Hyphomicrobiales bacterium]
MTDQLRAGQDLPSGRLHFGIRGRLFGALAAVASLTLIASVVAFLSYGHIGRSFQRIEHEGIPAIDHAVKLVLEADELAAASSALIAIDDRAALAAAVARVQLERRELGETLDALDVGLIGWSAYADLIDSVNILESNAISLAASIERRLAATAERERLGSEARAAHERLVEKLAPLLDDAEFNLMTGLQSAGELHDQAAIGRSLAQLADHDALAVQALSDLRAESNIVLGILTEVSLAPSADLLPPLRDRFIASSYRARQAVSTLGDAEGARELLSALETLLAFGKEGHGVFEARTSELAEIPKGWQLAATNQAVAATLAREAQSAVERAQAASAGALAGSRGAIQESQAVLIGLVLVSLVIASAITWFYVGNGLLRRLGALNQAMLSLAGGNLAVMIPHEGRDELSRMAVAVEVFKKNAIRSREMEADKEQGRMEELKRREASFRLLFHSNPIPMWVFAKESLRFLAVNDAAVAHYGYSRHQFLAMSILDIRPGEDREEIRKLAGTGKDNYRLGTRSHIKADGTAIQVVIYSQALTYEGHPAILVASIDNTERKRAEDELERTREFLNTIIESVPVSIVVKDARDFRYVLVNRAGEEFWGISRDEVIGKNAYEIYPKDSADTITDRDRQLLQAGRQLFFEDYTTGTPRRGPRAVSVRSVPILGQDQKPKYLLKVIEDITERKQAERQIAHLAHHDPLTDLPNRAALKERLASTLERAADSGAGFAILCMDLDRFKEINDVFGHSVGDELLCEAARRLRIAAGDAFLARLGGDEFTLIVADGPQPAAAVELADRLLAAVVDDVVIEGNQLRIGLSIGVAIFPMDGTDATSLLANADAALYRAKSEGRGVARFFEADMDKRLREHRALQHDLKSTIGRGELALHYQPQARIGGAVVGFEALIRWSHPTRGSVPPSSFIPVAEESGLIIAIGEWILREACREAASWPRPLQVAVNLSPVQFQHGDLPALVHAILLETGLAASRLELEITEGVLIGEPSRALSILRRLKTLGVKVAMDDFGTGYSSLSYLQSFPFDKIKIDRTFVANLELNPQSAAIIRAVIGLGRGLGLPIVAEGVETEGQLAFLAHEACDEVQGYLIGRPCPIADHAELVGRRSAGLLKRRSP